MLSADPWLKSAWFEAMNASWVRPSNPNSKRMDGSVQEPKSSAARLTLEDINALHAFS